MLVTNCKDINYFLGLRQLRQPVLLRLPIFWFSRKTFRCQLRDANSLMSTCDISKNERIKATEFNFTEMTSGRYVSIQSFHDFLHCHKQRW